MQPTTSNTLVTQLAHYVFQNHMTLVLANHLEHFSAQHQHQVNSKSPNRELFPTMSRTSDFFGLLLTGKFYSRLWGMGGLAIAAHTPLQDKNRQLHNVKSTSFFSLPREIGDHVYELLLTNSRPIWYPSSPNLEKPRLTLMDPLYCTPKSRAKPTRPTTE